MIELENPGEPETENKPSDFNSRLSFSTKFPNHQIAWDSTSLGALKRCPRYYQYSIVEGLTSRGESPHLRFGIEYNNALVTYHKSRAKGQDYDTAMISAIRYLLTQTWDNSLDRPWTSDEPTKNRETLLRSVIWYLDKYRDDNLKTEIFASGEPAVELSFRINLDLTSSLTGETYMLCGYLDRTVEVNGNLWITDFKTTKHLLDERYFDQYSPNNQVSQYAFAGTIIRHKPVGGVVIDAMQTGAGFSRFARKQIPRTQPQLEEWYADSVIFIQQNETYVENNYWPQNDSSCDKYGGCVFRPVCSADPSLRPIILRALFTPRLWDPLVVREI